MNLVRLYKINKLINKPLSKEHNEIIDFINWKISNLTEFKIDKFPVSVCYMDSNEKFIFQIQRKKDNTIKLFISVSGFLDFLDIAYSIDYHDAQPIIKYFIEKKYNIKINVTDTFLDLWKTEVEKEYKKSKK